MGGETDPRSFSLTEKPFRILSVRLEGVWVSILFPILPRSSVLQKVSGSEQENRRVIPPSISFLLFLVYTPQVGSLLPPLCQGQQQVNHSLLLGFQGALPSVSC